MIGQPRRNEDRFYRYPRRRVVAVIDDEVWLDAAARDRWRSATRGRIPSSDAVVGLPLPSRLAIDPPAHRQVGETARRSERNAMLHLRVRDVMNTEVPIADRFDVLVGVVSWTDLRDAIKIDDPDNKVRVGWATGSAASR